MYIQNEEKIYEAALDQWGKDFQILISIEEMAELIKELLKSLRYTNTNQESRNIVIENNIREEIVDVEIMLSQLKIIFFPPNININYGYREIKERKLDRLKEMLGVV